MRGRLTKSVLGISETELAFGHPEDWTPTHGYAATREDAMAAFAKSWQRDKARGMRKM